MINQVLRPKAQVLFTHNSAYIYPPAYQTYDHSTLDGWVAVERVRYERHYRRTAATPRGGQRTPPKAGGGIVPRRGVTKYPEGAARSPPPKGHTGRREPQLFCSLFLVPQFIEDKVTPFLCKCLSKLWECA